jgi:hypothetical protein
MVNQSLKEALVFFGKSINEERTGGPMGNKSMKQAFMFVGQTVN